MRRSLHDHLNVLNNSAHRLVNERLVAFLHPGYRDFPKYLHTEGEWISDNIRKNKTFYEIKVLHSLRKLVNLHCVIDIGANIGNHSKFFAKFGDGVFSIEPVKPNFDLLVQNAPSAKCLNLAISDKSERLEILYDKRNCGVARSLPFQEIYDGIQKFAVDATPLDDLEIEDPTFVKLDVEGSELKVLRGGVQTLTSGRPHLMIEIHHPDTLKHESYPYTLVELLKEIESLGFTLEVKLDATNWLFRRKGKSIF